MHNCIDQSRVKYSALIFRKLEDDELSDKVLSWRPAIKRVTWQLISKFLCSLCILGPVETRKLSFRSVSFHIGCLPWQKLMQKIAILTRACRLIATGLLFVFMDHGAGIRRATHLCLDCKERGQRLEHTINREYFVVKIFSDSQACAN